uniref:AAA+ ATPase domain-containing protein n=1 Tax=viral metagenome TaxID=1070528 RepID=A0A6C0KQE6_9ZZZZ
MKIINIFFIFFLFRMEFVSCFEQRVNLNQIINFQPPRRYQITRPDYIEKIRRLNSKNITIQNNSILGLDNDLDKENQTIFQQMNLPMPTLRINLSKGGYLEALGIIPIDNDNDNDNDNGKTGDFEDNDETNRRIYVERENTKSKNFEVIKNYHVNFTDVGGYDSVKGELEQCVDILKNYKKYSKYNVRIPKGLILEGPPGTGKTLIAKALAGEAKCGFIPVSGSDFQEKYVGVGPTRIKELFALAKKNIPCIIFIDEIDAVGRKRSTDGESSSNERDNTLNALLVEMDGFKNNTGVFIVAATNRIDLLDNALTRPGRIDKKIYIGLPDTKTRSKIIDIHIRGKPYCESINKTDLVEITEGLSGAQIENILNEAMLNALRMNNTQFCYKDFDLVMNKMMAGWQPVEHEFTSDIIDHIAIHEMGHAIVGFLSKYHSKMSKVVINLSSPKSPGYTVFKSSPSSLYKREALFEHLMILLSGRIAEEVFYNVSVTTGAINDFEEALKLAEKMIVYYGMGSSIIFPRNSEKYKELIDNEVQKLINSAYHYAEIIILECKDLIFETAEILKRDKILKAEKINDIIKEKYNHISEFKKNIE